MSEQFDEFINNCRDPHNNMWDTIPDLELVFKRAYRYSGFIREDIDDLVQEGIVALLEAEISYDPTKGASLLTWKWWQIERRMQKYCNQRKRLKYFDPNPKPNDDDSDQLQSLLWESGSTISISGYENLLVDHNPPPIWELLEEASEDVRVLCQLVLAHPEQFAGLPCHKAWRLLREMAGEVWKGVQEDTEDRVHEALQDAKAFFQLTGKEPLVRTIYQKEATT